MDVKIKATGDSKLDDRPVINKNNDKQKFSLFFNQVLETQLEIWKSKKMYHYHNIPTGTFTVILVCCCNAVLLTNILFNPP